MSSSSQQSTSSLSKKVISYHLGPIPYDDDSDFKEHLSPGSPRYNAPWEAPTRMVRDVEGDINGNLENDSNNDVIISGKSPPRSQSMHLNIPVWSQNKGNVDWSQEFVSTPLSEEGEEEEQITSSCQIPRSKTEIPRVQKKSMGHVDFKRSTTKHPPPGTLFHEVTFGQSLDSIALLYDSVPNYLLKLNKRTSRVVFAGEFILVPDKNNLDLLATHSKCKPKDDFLDETDDSSGKRYTNSLLSNKNNPMDLTSSVQKTDTSNLPLGEDKENVHSGLSVTGFIAEGWAGFRKKKTTTLERKVKRPRPLTRDESIQINKQCAENFLKIPVTQILPNEETVEGTLLITPNAVMFETQPVNEENGKSHTPLDLIIPMRLISSASMFSDLSNFSLPPGQKTTSASSIDTKSPTSPDYKTAAESSAAASPTDLNLAKHEAEVGSPRGESLPNSFPAQSALAKFFSAVEGDTGALDVYSIDELPLYLRILLFDPDTTVIASKKNDAQMKDLKVTGPAQSQYWFKLPAEWVDRVYAFFVQWTPEESTDGEADEKNTFVMVSVDDGPDSGLANEAFVHGTSAQPQTLPPLSGPIYEEDSQGLDDVEGNMRNTRKLSDSFWQNQSMSRKYTKEWEILHHDEYSRRQARLLEQTLALPEIHGESLIMTIAHVRKMVPNLPSRCMGANWCCLYNSTLDGLSLNTLYRKCKSPPLDRGTCCMLIIEPREKKRPNSPQSPTTNCSESTANVPASPSPSPCSSPTWNTCTQQRSGSNLSTECTKDLFGVVLSNPPACREGFYGNGQTFVFKFTDKNPEKTSSRLKRRLTETVNQASAETNRELDSWNLQCFNWAGSNNLFISCGNDHITVGGDKCHAKPALLIDADLNRGQTFECETFDSPKLTGNSGSRFEISAIELWAFIPEHVLDSMSIDFSGNLDV